MKARKNHKRIRRRATFKLPKTKSRPLGTWVVGR